MQSTPAFIPQAVDARTGNTLFALSVSCGSAHCLCIGIDGTLWAWGANTAGQLGIGLRDSGFLQDEESPQPVPPFACTRSQQSESQMKAVQVSCGPCHSLALDSEGTVWSWGGMGGLCLGHCDASLSGPWAEKIQSIFSPSAVSNVTKIMVPYELRSWVRTWSTPRRIEALFGRSVLRVDCGAGVSSFICRDGRVLLCGDDPVLPPFNVNAPEDQENEQSSSAVGGNVATQERKVLSAPRSPSGVWLTQLSTRRVVTITFGGGASYSPFFSGRPHSFVFVVVDEEHTARLTSTLLRRATKQTSIEGTDDNASIGSETLSSASVDRLTLPLGGVDCVIVAGGRQLLAHKCVLSQVGSFLK